ncbi:MAG: TetR/AcrR family transcriptional regulator [Actinomycetota bacterium]|nr:TetR/AcrR family transcriptional regulator [Actinomycetota bacterium]
MSTSTRGAPAEAVAPEQKREREIVEAAARLFCERGYLGTSTQQIAEEVGMLKGSLYHYVRSKADILYRVIEDVHRQFTACVEEDLAAGGTADLARIEAFLNRHLDLLLANAVACEVYRSSLRHLEPEARCVVLAERTRYERHVTDMIEQAQTTGEARSDLPASLLATLCLVLVNRAAAGGTDHEPEVVKRAVASLLHRGLVPGLP